MPILGGLLVSLFGSLATFLTKFLAVRAAAVVAAIAAFLTLTLGLYAAAAAAHATLTVAFPSMLMTGVWLMVPDNAGICLGALIATDTAVALYRWNVENLHIASRTA